MPEPERITGPELVRATEPDPKTLRRQMQDEWAAEEADRRAQEEADRRLKNLAIPPFYADTTLDSFVADTPQRKTILAFARRYAASWPDAQLMTLFRGGFRTGKGHIAWSLVKHVGLEKRHSARVVKLADMVRDLRARWNGGEGASEEETLARYRNYRLLVIDEISKHAFYGQNIHQHLYDVLDHRLEQCRPTILTSNETPEGIADVLQGALWHRLNENGGIIDFGTDSYRKARKSSSARSVPTKLG